MSTQTPNTLERGKDQAHSLISVLLPLPLISLLSIVYET